MDVRTSKKWPVLGLLVVASALRVAGAQVPAATMALSHEQIEAAIAYGAEHDVDPELYPLPSVFSVSRPHVEPVGYIFNPFLRIALAANRAAKLGTPLTVDTVPRQLLEPLIYVWMWAQDDPVGFERPNDVEHRMEILPYLSEGLILSRQTYKPVWIVQDGIQLLPFGPVYSARPRAAIVAAFAPELFQDGRIVALYRSWSEKGGPGNLQLTLGLLRDTDIRSWR